MTRTYYHVTIRIHLPSPLIGHEIGALQLYVRKIFLERGEGIQDAYVTQEMYASRFYAYGEARQWIEDNRAYLGQGIPMIQGRLYYNHETYNWTAFCPVTVPHTPVYPHELPDPVSDFERPE